MVYKSDEVSVAIPISCRDRPQLSVYTKFKTPEPPSSTKLPIDSLINVRLVPRLFTYKDSGYEA